ncbi:MAG: TetR family transcriptional regulator [Gammaproteobacteria bacterium]|nr:TetR family transcriptional regulator [Gammaproteobacteria bacterium]
MVARETVGLRKKNTGVRKRGKERREQLIKAAYDLLCEQPVEAIAFIDIAKRAAIPEGSAYHFFSNKYDVFSALAEELTEEFIISLKRPFRKDQITSWQDLADQFVKRGIRVYRNNPPAGQLFLGGKTPPEIKLQDRLNDRAVAEAMLDVLNEHFVLPDIPNFQNILYYFIEITDLMLSLSILENGKITGEMIEEAQRAGRGYLSSHLPENLVKRRRTA